jgi:hypothetical protein
VEGVILLLGLLALLIISPGFRRFAVVCVVLIVAIVVLGGMAIHWDKQQTMARECSPAGFAERQKDIEGWQRFAHNDPKVVDPMTADSRERNIECNKWLIEHPH